MYWVPILYVPLLMITHVAAFTLLLRRPVEIGTTVANCPSPRPDASLLPWRYLDFACDPIKRAQQREANPQQLFQNLHKSDH
jgi:hypothetical protein